MKEQVNISTLGHAKQGKTTLTRAICTVLFKAYGGAVNNLEWPTDMFVEESSASIFPDFTSHTEYETLTRHYSHIDCSGDVDAVKNMLAGSTQIDGAILVVSASEGPTPQTREHIELSVEAGIPYIIVFLNKNDMVDDEHLLDLIEMEVRYLLSEYDFPGEDLPVIRGSALEALNGKELWESKIIDLAGAMDTYIQKQSL
jgi:elongation factor Tu